MSDHPALTEEGGISGPAQGEAVSDYFSFSEIFRRVLASGDEELDRGGLALFLSALGAGGALGLTFLARIVLTEGAGEAEPGLVGNLLYPVGFLVIVLGRYQLYTENTLTPVLLVMTRLASLRDLLRLWSIVFFGNMAGAALFAAAVAYTTVLTPERAATALAIGRHAVATSPMDLFYRSVVAGTIVAAMVWVVHAMRDSIGRAVVVYVMMYLVGAGTFFHVITSSLEAFYAAFADPAVGFWPIWPRFVAPVLAGNTLGGVVIVAMLHYAQISEKMSGDVYAPYGRRLDGSRLVFGSRDDADRRMIPAPSEDAGRSS